MYDFLVVVWVALWVMLGIAVKIYLDKVDRIHRLVKSLVPYNPGRTFPRAVAAMDKISEQGAVLHPDNDSWPPEYTDKENLRRAGAHLDEYLRGIDVDEHGMNMLAKVMWRIAAVVERREKIKGR